MTAINSDPERRRAFKAALEDGAREMAGIAGLTAADMADGYLEAAIEAGAAAFGPDLMAKRLQVKAALLGTMIFGPQGEA